MIACLLVERIYSVDIALVGTKRGGGSVMVELEGGKVCPQAAINPSSTANLVLRSCTLLMYFRGSLFSFPYFPLGRCQFCKL